MGENNYSIPSITDIYVYMKEYSFMYVIFDAKAKINYSNRRIYFNPMFNEEYESFCHEIFHHHFDNVLGIIMSEEDVEKISQEYFQKHRKGIEYIVQKHIMNRLES
jgi:hypothetical protein